MMGPDLQLPEDENTPEKRTAKIFNQLDKNADEQVSSSDKIYARPPCRKTKQVPGVLRSKSKVTLHLRSMKRRDKFVRTTMRLFQCNFLFNIFSFCGCNLCPLNYSIEFQLILFDSATDVEIF